MKICNDIYYIGVNDYQIDLFEGQYPVPNGMAYNSYLIIDDKVAVLDTVDKKFKTKWLNNIKNILNNRQVDYLIIHHMEPDHSANIMYFMSEYPNAKIVASCKAFLMMKNFFNEDFINNRIIVNDNDELHLGNHTLKFYLAPMVHWPEVIMSYEVNNKILFSADAFGKFGALDKDEDWICEARRYYFGIVGKYGLQVKCILNKISNLDINMICSLHGPILKGNLNDYLNLYYKWSNYEPEEDGIVICYTSIYGHTLEAVNKLKELLIKKGMKNVVVHDLARCDIYKAIEDAFRYDKLILATTTYNGDIFPKMKTFIEALIERNYQKRKIGFIENGSWCVVAAKTMKCMLSNCKNITYYDTTNVSVAHKKIEITIDIDSLSQSFFVLYILFS